MRYASKSAMDTIICPHCKKSFELSQVIIHALQEAAELKQKAVFEKEKAGIQLKAEEKIKKELELRKSTNQKLENQLISLKKAQEENERKRKEESEKIKLDAQKKAEEDQRLKLREKDLQLEQARKVNDELKRKLDEGSQQRQGEAMELDLEENLASTFRYDEFLPVPKGITGGDIIQIVRNKFGSTAGSILWEAKRSKTWSKLWLIKLREDMRKIDANDCILVSDVLPPNVKVYERIDNVWVTSYAYALPLASVLRDGLIKVAIAKSSASHTDEELRGLYRLITSESFKNKFEARNETIRNMKLGLESDERAMDRIFKRRKVEIEKLERNNNQLYSELQAHVPSLLPLKEPEMIELESGE